MHDQQVATPDNTAVRTALWRALHVEVDSPPHVFEDTVGLKLAAVAIFTLAKGYRNGEADEAI